LRTVFLGSPPFATPVLERLVRSRHRPLALVTLPDKPRGRSREVEESELVRAARGHGLAVFQPADPHAPEFLGELRTLRPEVLCVASYGVILKPALLELCPQGALNVHGSLLPRWRGASPIQAAVLAGDAVTGVSIQRIVLALDEGDVLLARERTIGARETSGDLFASLAVLGGEALVEALDRLEDGEATFTPQDPRVRPTRARSARNVARSTGPSPRSSSSVRCAPSIRGRSCASAIRRVASSTCSRRRWSSGTKPPSRAPCSKPARASSSLAAAARSSCSSCRPRASVRCRPRIPARCAHSQGREGRHAPDETEMSRLVAFAILRSGSTTPLRDVERFSDEAELDARDRGLVRRILGTEVRHRTTIRAVIHAIAPAIKNAEMLAHLHVALAQALFLDRIPPHAVLAPSARTPCARRWGPRRSASRASS
jgi:folate-dependent phosphoribosylglycinamide formyltransferase PurN